MTNHKDIYKNAELYDIAFDFRDVPKECDFLTESCERFSGRKPASFLELAAGPAWHTREFARRGLDACALDLSPDMVAYGLDKARQDGVKIRYECGDMVSFEIDMKFDLVAILMDSTSYLLDNESVLKHFSSVADCLNPGGVYVLEMGHPRDAFNIGKSTTGTDWEMSRDGKTVHMVWGEKDDPFDPITQQSQTTVTIEVTTDEGTETIKEIATQRCFTATEFAALVQASGRFEMVHRFGSLDSSIPFSNDEKAWRMAPILKKV